MLPEVFLSHFDCEPQVTVVSPGRINLIGEHVDYLGGKVMPVAIDRHLVIEAAEGEPDSWTFSPAGMGFGERVSVDADGLHRRENRGETWLNYIIGVLAVYRNAGIEVPGFQALIRSDLPVGAGLSSSAALETAVALVIESLTGVDQEVVDRALLCQRAEHDFAGVPCGIMDQLAVGGGRAETVMELDCRDLSRSYHPFPDGVAILTADTGVKHALGDGEYEKRRQDCEETLSILSAESFREVSLDDLLPWEGKLGDRLFRRARHAVTEMDRVESFAIALEANDLDALGVAMRGSHESLRDDYEVSCKELDALAEAAWSFGRERGLIGSRMTGGGFGGSTVSLVRADSAERLKEHLENFYHEKFGRELNCFITAAVDGARAVSIT